MQEAPIRILHIVSIMNRGGIETFLMNAYRKLDKSKVQFDFLVTRDEIGVFDEEILSLGGEIYRIPHIKKIGFKKYVKTALTFLKTSEHKVIHCHMNTWSGLFLTLSRIAKKPIRIAHSHSSQKSIKPKSIPEAKELFVKSLMKSFINYSATHFFSCSYDAGEWLFGKNIATSKLKLIKNCVDVERLIFNRETSTRIRKMLNIDDGKFVIGHIGNMTYPKNTIFLLEVFSEILEKRPDSLLLLIGNGPMREEIIDYLKKKQIDNKVVLLGVRDDVHDLLKVFDVFVMPSIYEGIPLSVIEAQVAAVPCVLSDTITNEVDMGLGDIDFISLEERIDRWVEIILKERDINKSRSINNVKKLGYDSQAVANELMEFYINNLNTTKKEEVRNVNYNSNSCS